MIFIGIDPGITGGIVRIDGDGMLEGYARTPAIKVGAKREYDLPGMDEMLGDSSSGVVACIEKVGTLPRDGRVGAFSFGKGYGLWLGMLAARKIPYFEVPPQRWQAMMLAGLPRGPKTKLSAVQRSKSLFPQLPLKVKADWGMADAALIAEYCRRTWTS